MKLKFTDFTEAFQTFLLGNCVAYGYGEIGEAPPPYCNREIRIVLKESGAGYIHLLGEDSDTIDFMTMDHFRSQGMITPEQREKINKLTQAKASKIIRDENSKLKAEIAELTLKLSKIKDTL